MNQEHSTWWTWLRASSAEIVIILNTINKNLPGRATDEPARPRPRAMQLREGTVETSNYEGWTLGNVDESNTKICGEVFEITSWGEAKKLSGQRVWEK